MSELEAQLAQKTEENALLEEMLNAAGGGGGDSAALEALQAENDKLREQVAKAKELPRIEAELRRTQNEVCMTPFKSRRPAPPPFLAVSPSWFAPSSRAVSWWLSLLHVVLLPPPLLVVVVVLLLLFLLPPLRPPAPPPTPGACS